MNFSALTLYLLEMKPVPGDVPQSPTGTSIGGLLMTHLLAMSVSTDGRYFNATLLWCQAVVESVF
jgi:hypothetical protein